VSAAVWHEVENGSYRADLPLWRELAAQADGAILDLGAGIGRVALDLAAEGHELVALDEDAELLAVLRERAAPSVRTVVADARSFALERRFALVLAPMQLVQILGGPAERAAMLRCVHQHLLPDGVFAAALADPHAAIPSEPAEPPLPDMVERDGWLFSSQPVSVTEHSGRVVIERVRQAVAPDGGLAEERARIALEVVSVEELEEQARAAGLEPGGRRSIPETSDHIGSEVVICRRR
jgi:SAM-dependent methyltransferase